MRLPRLSRPSLHRAALFLLLPLLATACTSDLDPDVARTGIGDFSLDRVVVIVDGPLVPPYSRSLSEAAVKSAVEDSLQARFGRFEGTGSYSIGVKVQGYVLSGPAVPVLFAPRSQLFLSVNAYDDSPARLNADTLNLTVHEDAGGDTVVGSGYSQTAEEQIAELASNAAIEIERWLRKNPDWFTGAARAAASETAAATGG
jgi:hypothetical protein